VHHVDKRRFAHRWVLRQLSSSHLYSHGLRIVSRLQTMLMDHGEKLKELFDIHTRKTLAFVEHLLEHTDVRFFLSNDNLDVMLIPPYFFDEFLMDHFRAVADLIHSRGGYFWVHSCGNNYELADCIKRSGIDCMEGLTQPPLGNFPLHAAHELIGPTFVVNGGNSCHEQERFEEDSADYVRDYSVALFKSMKNNPRFIYASSCNTSPRTPWRNLVALRDAAREFGH